MCAQHAYAPLLILLVITSLPPLITEKKQSTLIGRLASSSTSSSVRTTVLGLAKDVDKLGVAPGSDPPGLSLCAGPTSVCHHKSARRQTARVHTRTQPSPRQFIVMAAPTPYAVDWVSSSSVSAPASSRSGDHTPSRSPQTHRPAIAPAATKKTPNRASPVFTHKSFVRPSRSCYSFNGLHLSPGPHFAPLASLSIASLRGPYSVPHPCSSVSHTCYYFASSVACRRPLCSSPVPVLCDRHRLYRWVSEVPELFRPPQTRPLCAPRLYVAPFSCCSVASSSSVEFDPIASTSSDYTV